MLAKMNNFFGAIYATHEASKSCKYEFFISQLFPFSPPNHLLNHTNTIISTWIFCSRVVFIDILVDGTTLANFYVLGDESLEILK